MFYYLVTVLRFTFLPYYRPFSHVSLDNLGYTIRFSIGSFVGLFCHNTLYQELLKLYEMKMLYCKAVNKVEVRTFSRTQLVFLLVKVFIRLFTDCCYKKKVLSRIFSYVRTLSRVAPYMNESKKRILMNSFFWSQCSYCPLVWMFHSRTLNNKINCFHERCSE